MYEELKLKNQLCYPIYLCSKEIIRKYSKYLDTVDLTYTQYVVMMYFWEVKVSNVKDLANTILIDSSTLTPLLKKLEQKGFIERNINKVDERNLVLKLTKKGEKLKDKAKDIPKEMGKCLNLSEEESKTLYTILYKVLHNIEEEIKNDKRN